MGWDKLLDDEFINRCSQVVEEVAGIVMTRKYSANSCMLLHAFANAIM